MHKANVCYTSLTGAEVDRWPGRSRTYTLLLNRKLHCRIMLRAIERTSARISRGSCNSISAHHVNHCRPQPRSCPQLFSRHSMRGSNPRDQTENLAGSLYLNRACVVPTGFEPASSALKEQEAIPITPRDHRTSYPRLDSNQRLSFKRAELNHLSYEGR